MTKQEAINRLEEGAPFSELYDEAWENALTMAIDSLKADSVKHGKWIKEDHDGSWSSATCSICGRRVGLVNYETDFAKHFPYCHCGARMDEELQ